MPSQITKYILLITLVYPIFQANAEELKSKDLKASIAILPGHSEVGIDGKPIGGFVEIAQAINDAYSAGNISIKLYPFARSLINVEDGKADFHITLIKSAYVPLETLTFAYATECITQVSFVLYTRADTSPLEHATLAQYEVVTIRGHKQLFSFKVSEVNDHQQGINMLTSGRVDGFLVEQDVTDKYIRKYRINNIRRTLYSVLDSCIVIPNDSRKIEIDNIISAALRKLKKSGELQKISETIHQPYLEWQPYQMGW